MRILIACEESQVVCNEFRKLEHEAYYCDILPRSGGHPEWHIQGDVLNIPIFRKSYCDVEILDQRPDYKWDMIIAFPPCTFLTVTGNRWFNIDKYGDKAIKRHADRKEAICFFMLFANANCNKVVIENPIGIMSSEWKKPNQIINPYQFGDAFEKKTCLWTNAKVS